MYVAGSGAEENNTAEANNTAEENNTAEANNTAEENNTAEANNTVEENNTAEANNTADNTGISRWPILLQTYRGKRRQWSTLSRDELIFVVVTALNLVVTGVVTITRAVTVSDRDADFTFALVLIVRLLFCSHHIFFGVLQERCSLMITLCMSVSSICFSIYLNYFRGKRDWIKLARLIISSIFLPFTVLPGIYFIWRYYRHGTVLSNTAGVEALRKSVKKLYTYIDKLLYDLQICISLVLYVMTSRQQFNNTDMMVLVFGFPFSLGCLVMFQQTVTNKSKIRAILSVVGGLCQLAYVGYLIYETYEHEATRFPGLAFSVYWCIGEAFLAKVFLIYHGIRAYRAMSPELTKAVFGNGMTLGDTEQNYQVLEESTSTIDA